VRAARLGVPPASLEGCVDLGVGMCNSSGAKTLRAFAAEAWEGLAEASGGGRSLARTRPGEPQEVDLMEWWPAARAVAPPWRKGDAVQRCSGGARPRIGIHPPKSRFVKLLARRLLQQGRAAADADAEEGGGEWWRLEEGAAAAAESRGREHSCGLLVYRFEPAAGAEQQQPPQQQQPLQQVAAAEEAAVWRLRQRKRQGKRRRRRVLPRRLLPRRHRRRRPGP